MYQKEIVVVPGKWNDIYLAFGRLRNKKPMDPKWHTGKVWRWNRSFGVQLEGNETWRHRVKMLIIRHSVWASSELDHCTAHSPPAAPPTPVLLSIHSTLATPLLCRDQRHREWANNEQEHLLSTEPLSPSSPENSGCVKILAFVCMWFLSQIIFLWLSGVSGGRGLATLNLQWHIVLTVRALTSLRVSCSSFCYWKKQTCCGCLNGKCPP